ncbi:hypothetical protein MUK42_34541 [Musa troglodytarum]|uniref:Uncharacterized protein n=1 Tax=Musa troglodytarum TaxID=320322 RepID=A0A9E7EDM0_9LILI|nr:hypothetical protein MUK42_34541 [Musa troglodytarum]
MLLVPSLVLLLSFSLSAPSVISYRDDGRWIESVIPKLHIDTCVPTSTDGHCVPQIVVNDFLDVDAMVIVPRRVWSNGRPQDDEGTTLWVGTNNYQEACMPAITIVGRAPVMLHNCSSKVLDYHRLLCCPPDLNPISVDYFVPTMDLHQLNCTTLIYTPFGYDANGRGIWSSVEAELYVSRTSIDWSDECMDSGGLYVDNAIIGRSCLYHYSSHLKDDPSQGGSVVVTGHHHKAKAMKEILFDVELRLLIPPVPDSNLQVDLDR